ncbi:polycystin-2-like [Mercenaria mercenaria]|uniref:polycystin-2-like n=1 Tax=Mercenaria mercenaria TaxID=6596 RepID=UPI00234EC0B7|nr:polycystin-2-like [Mercenaria mercenaria]
MINWLNYTLIPYLFLERDEHGAVANWTERQFTKDYIHYRLGPPRLRQLRTKNGTCNIPYIGYMTCYGEYIIWNEEDEDYCIGWKRKPCKKTELAYNLSSDAWTFTSALDNWGLPWPGYYTTYGGGGYIASLHVNLNYSIDIMSELYRNLWMDRQTRAVIVDFTLYAAATNIFVYNIYVIEFPQTGGAFTSFSTYPVRAYPHQGTSGAWIVVCEVLFVIYLVGLFGKICLRIYRQRWDYFVQFWRVYDLGILLVAAIVLFTIRLEFSFETIQKFKQDKKLFVNFIHIVFWDQLLVFFLSVLAFLATLRMMEVFSTLNKVRAIVEIFSQCGKDLFWYGLTFAQIFIGFCGFSLLLFGSKLASYRNMYQCMGTLFIAMIGKSKFTEINETQPLLAKFFFMLYVLVVVYFILTIFLSILGASIDQVVQGNRKSSEYDLITFLMQNFKALLFTPRRTRQVKDVQN